jgi:hypothetical protein
MNFKEWYNSTLAHEHTKEKLFASEHGWDACKKEVLKILKQPIQNCDLSWEETDSRFIEKIEKL